MPVFGKNQSNSMSCLNNSIKPFAKQFAKVASDILKENAVDLFSEAGNLCRREDAYSSLRDFFVNESVDANLLSPEELADHQLMMEQRFENDRQAILEYAPIGSFNPVIGMSFPMYKYLLMNNVFDNGGISKAVLNTPKTTFTMEKRFMVTPEGKEIDLFYDQAKIKDAFDSSVPYKVIEMTLPEQSTTDLIAAIGAGSMDSIAVESYISGILVEVIKVPAVYGADGTSVTSPAQTEDVWINVNYTFTPGYGDGEKRYINESIYVDHEVCETQSETAEPVRDYLSGMLYKNRLVMSSNGGHVKAVRLTARKDTSNGLVNTCTVKWKTVESFVEVGSAIPINVPVSPEEIKDVQALYNENQLAKLMSIIKDVMGNWKDDSIKEHLDKSYTALPKSQKFSGSINFAVNGQYLTSDPVTWRHSIFMDQLDTYATKMIQVWNDPNVDITVIGRTDIIRKIMPIEYKGAQTSSSVGPVNLDFKRTVFSTDNRRYDFISTDKIRDDGVGHWSGEGNNPNSIIVLLRPRGTDRMMYVVFDYQLYIANDIRNAANPTLPAVHAFDRWKFYEYQPVQGRIEILNTTGFEA